MTTKEELHRLIDELPDGALVEAENLLGRLNAQSGTEALVERLNRRRELIMRGRQFDDSTELLRQIREAHGAGN